jgi:eukaryotic-like serine/threonine-protein kinase
MAGPYPEVGGDDVLVGSVVADSYHVAGILGQGTTGTVFGVEHIHFGRRAAMKVLRPRSTATDVVHRVFHGDARAAWSVNHACVADVFDVGTLPDGAPFFVSEYLEGETLAKRMTRDRLSLAAAVDVMMQILAAITAVHERALLVRDLRPQNVFLAHRRGCRPIAKLLDLGLGRLTPLEAISEQWDADPKAAAVTYPHPFYLSPERTRSEHGIDYASDLFVAGVIFYEMLTGSRPFSASTYNGLLLQIAQANPTPVSELRDHSLPELDDFVEHALSGNPRFRFASAKEMQDELRRVFEGKKKGASAAPMTASSQTVQAVNMHAPAPPSGTGPTAVPVMGMMPSLAPAAQSLAVMAAPPSPHGAPLPPPAPPSRHSPMASTMGPGSHHSSNRIPAAVSSVSPIASLLEPEPSPRDRTLANDVPTKTATELPVDLDGDLYADETETDRKFFDVSPYRDPASSSRMQAASSRRPAPSAQMPATESPADEDQKTMPPLPAMELAQPATVQAFKPVKIGSADDFEEPTESRNALSDDVLRSIREGNKTPLPPVPEEETQQLEMTPEIRAKIEAQYAARPVPPAPVAHRAPMSSEMDSIPPPTKRLDK